MKNIGFLVREFGDVLSPLALVSVVVLFLLLFGDKERRKKVATILVVAGLVAFATTGTSGRLASFEEAIAGTFAIGGTFLVIVFPLAIVLWVAFKPRGG